MRSARSVAAASCSAPTGPLMRRDATTTSPRPIASSAAAAATACSVSVRALRTRLSFDVATTTFQP